MKKLSFSFIGAVLPAFAFAAYNDVSLTTSAVLSVGGYTLNVTGSTAAVQSIVVNTSSFSVTLASGSTLKVSSPTFQQCSVDNSSFMVSNSCSDNTSVLTLGSSGPSGTVTVTPSASICSTPGSSGGGSGGSSSGGNGAPAGLMGQYTTKTKPVTTSTTTPVISPSGTSIQNQNNISSKSSGKSIGTATFSFTRNLSAGMKSEDVRSLQKFLNVHGFIFSKTGTGSLGNESTLFGSLTVKALKAFQKSAGLPSTGFFGPMTRAYIQKESKLHSSLLDYQ